MGIDRKQVFDDTPSARIDAAVQYSLDMEMVEGITGHKTTDIRRVRSSAFTAGYDYAMSRRHDELLQENQQLHGLLLDIQMEARGYPTPPGHKE